MPGVYLELQITWRADKRHYLQMSISRLAAAVLAGFLLVSFAEAQKSINDLPKAQRLVLARYLKTHRQYRFATEDRFDAETLKYMRQDSKGQLPYYISGDFNHDGHKDFAVILLKAGKIDPDDENSSMVLVFNGTRSAYKLADTESQRFNNSDFLEFDKGEIGWLTAESDAGMYLSWRKGKYVRHLPEGID